MKVRKASPPVKISKNLTMYYLIYCIDHKCSSSKKTLLFPNQMVEVMLGWPHLKGETI